MSLLAPVAAPTSNAARCCAKVTLNLMGMEELKMTSSVKPLLTVADLDAFPEDDGNRYELINGELFVSRAPGIPHQRVLLNLEVALSNYLKANPIGILVPGAGAIFSDSDAVIPDLVFVCNERWNDVVTGEKFSGAVDLVVEVLSPGQQNRDRDLTAKRKLYAKYGVTEYWIVDSENVQVLIFHLQSQALEPIVILDINDGITSPLFPRLVLKVRQIFACSFFLDLPSVPQFELPPCVSHVTKFSAP
jgi:Uma2 family endonuclease